jgi:hypothetical protein
MTLGQPTRLAGNIRNRKNIGILWLSKAVVTSKDETIHQCLGVSDRSSNKANLDDTTCLLGVTKASEQNYKQ